MSEALKDGESAEPRIPFYLLRHYFFLFAALFALIVPFIEINGNGLFRLSFIHRRLEFLGMRFDTSQLYVLPFMIFMFAAFVLLVTSVGGRIWCGWACPQTMFRFVYRDLIQDKILRLRKRKDKQRKLRLDTYGKKIRFITGFFLFACVAFLGTANLLWFFVKPSEFFVILLNRPEEYPFLFGFWIFMSLFFVIDITYIQENFCKYICPYARIQSVFFDRETALVMYDEPRGNNTDGSKGMKNFQGLRDRSGDCTDCMACVKVCPTGIDIRNGLQLGCIECLECVDACYPIMQRKGKENLINWTTEARAVGGKSRFIRPRTIFYSVVVIASLSILLYLSFSRSEVVMHVNRTSQLYFVKSEDKIVENYYILLLGNDTNQEMELSFRLEGDIPVFSKRGGDDFILFPHEKKKKTLILASPVSAGVSDQSEMKPVPILIRLVDKKNPDQPVVEHKVMFFLPNQK